MLGISGYVALQNLRSWSPPPHHLHIEWWMLAPIFALSAFFIVHFEVRRQAHSLELTAFPFTVALFALAPPVLVLVQVLATLPAFSARYGRQPRKFAFNLANRIVESVTGIAVFYAIAGSPDALSPRSWLAAFAAAFAELLAGS